MIPQDIENYSFYITGVSYFYDFPSGCFSLIMETVSILKDLVPAFVWLKLCQYTVAVKAVFLVYEDFCARISGTALGKPPHLLFKS